MKPVIALLAMSFVVGTFSAAAQVSFTAFTNYPVGQQPESLVAADTTGSGKVDIVAANFTGTPEASTLTVLTNDGYGNFGSNGVLVVGGNPNWLAAGDFNRDGRVDFITANAFSTLTVLTNAGDGVFGSNATYTFGTTGSDSFHVVVTDVNGDGSQDLAYLDPVGTRILILTNDGTGIFSSNSVCAVGNTPNGLTAADLNHRGKPDLITANDGDNTLTILTNNGFGEFGSNATLHTGDVPLSACAADLFGRHKLDLICANQSDGSLSIFTNNGNGIYGSNATYTVGTTPSSVASADINGDGRPDLVCALQRGSSLMVLTNDGSGKFVSASALSTSNGITEVLTADVNGDGKPDLIAVNANIYAVSVALNTSTFPATNSAPRPAIARQTNGLLVSWPAAAPGWSLHQTTDLPDTRWPASGFDGYPLADNGTNKSLFIAAPSGAKFFKLLHP